MSFWIRFGPVCGIAGGQVHATNAVRGKQVKRKTFDAACGRRVVLLTHGVHGKPDDRITVSWPPYVADAREWGYERCRDCMTMQPGKPVRAQMAATP